MERDLAALGNAADGKKAVDLALRVAQNVTDLRLRYELLPTVDRDRLALWTRQLTIDAKAENEGAVAGDVTSLQLVWDRVRLEAQGTASVDTHLKKLRAAADAGDMAQVQRLASELAQRVAGLNAS
ncbi:hypothetical protein ACIBQ5_02265 [Streptomyces massasporeus]|uniref:hypothetical protein n=1 Tax=Streptomyces massasporeus TaxID=67324 RepID=UPI00378AD340